MDIHKNARLSFRSREALGKFVMEQGATRKAAAAAFRVSAKTVAKWVGRYRQFGAAGLGDRSSRPPPLPAADKFFFSGRGGCSSSRPHAWLRDCAAHRVSVRRR